MLKYIIKRVLMLVPVLLGVTFIIFVLLSVTTGDPAEIILGEAATPETVAELHEEMGLDDPLPIRFGKFVWNFVSKGDLGRSYTTNEPVTELIAARFPNTLKLAAAATLMSVAVGLTFGIISAIRPYSMVDNVVMSVALIGVSMPRFWQGLLLILLFSINLGWLPSSSTNLSSMKELFLPALTVALASAAETARMTRSSMLEVIRQDYVVTAKAKGLPERMVVLRHALRNALIPIITIVGINFGVLLGGAVVVESIFSISGVGKLMVDAIKARNYPVVQGGVLYIAFAFCMVNLLVDILYTFADPRVKSRLR
ncbi:ABC transporter permease [uncultured Clostridium sp.]|uniref:ABC transporter permease n=1 Tax=uncultured Clostridium sp. TaxID=59620 RepID=UPI0025CE1D74|nr:ABC transporter permease [uncultured Clostridium sp.]